MIIFNYMELTLSEGELEKTIIPSVVTTQKLREIFILIESI